VFCCTYANGCHSQGALIMADSLFRTVLTPENFARLPAFVQAAHSGESVILRGSADITRGAGWLSRLCAVCARLPRAGSAVPTQVQITANGGAEHWLRQFGRSRMPSTLSCTPLGTLRERLGAVSIEFALELDSAPGETPTGFYWRVTRVTILGALPLPLRWFTAVHAHSYSDAQSYRFLVSASLPGIGLLVRYEGTLA
jgi:hypothetical protein